MTDQKKEKAYELLVSLTKLLDCSLFDDYNKGNTVDHDVLDVYKCINVARASCMKIKGIK